MTLPTQGLSSSEIDAALAQFAGHDLAWRDGKTYAYVYDAGREVEQIGTEAFARYLFVNALDPTAFPSALGLENALTGLAAEHLRGDENVVGTFTSGGTESILCAVKAARDWARATKPHIQRPNVILPTTVHPAFHKAAHYLGLDVIPVDVDDASFRANPDACRAAITPDTILLVGSSPSYAHGVIDPIPALGQLALEHDLWLHVDACVGGFLLPYLRRLEDQPAHDDFDFSVPGVTSISMDFHKYAFVPKGASVVLYRDASLRRFQYFGCTDWPGYTLLNPSVMSSKSAGPLAATWAVLNHIGDQGYLELTRRAMHGTAKLLAGLAEIPELHVLGQPDFCMVSFASDQLSVFHLVDEMKARGWFLQPQFQFRNSPANVHLSLGPENAARVDELLRDLRDAVAAAKQLPTGQLAAMVAGAFQDLEGAPDPAQLQQLLALAGVQGNQLPERMAPINEVLDALPKPVCRELLIDFLAGMFQPAAAAAAVG